MGATIAFRISGDGTLREAIDTLTLEFKDILEDLGDRLSVVRAKDTPLGAGEPAYIAIEIKMKMITKEMLVDLRPIIRFVVRLLEKHTDQKVAATISFSDGGDSETYAM